MAESDQERPSGPRPDLLSIPHRDPMSIPRREPLPSGPPAWVLKFGALTGVIIFSFWIALVALDKWAFDKSDRAGSAGPREFRQIFSIDLARRNWTVANFKTRAAALDKAIALESTADINEYQWLTDPIPVPRNAEVSVSYNIDVTSGRMGLGILDFDSNKWIVSKEISSPSEAIKIKAPATQIQVILFAVAAGPSRATLRELTVARFL
jgi:hypothetical protein